MTEIERRAFVYCKYCCKKLNDCRPHLLILTLKKLKDEGFYKITKVVYKCLWCGQTSWEADFDKKDSIINNIQQKLDKWIQMAEYSYSKDLCKNLKK